MNQIKIEMEIETNHTEKSSDGKRSNPNFTKTGKMDNPDGTTSERTQYYPEINQVNDVYQQKEQRKYLKLFLVDDENNLIVKGSPENSKNIENGSKKSRRTRLNVHKILIFFEQRNSVRKNNYHHYIGKHFSQSAFTCANIPPPHFATLVSGLF